MNKNSNNDETIIDPENINSSNSNGENNSTPPPFVEDENAYIGIEEPNNEYKLKESTNNNGMIAAAAGVALVGGGVAAYAIASSDSDEIAEKSVEATEPKDTNTIIEHEANVKSLSVNINVPESLDEIKFTNIVTDDMSFAEAFAAARREVGPHGVFEWHGGVYGTYYENEWEQMPADYKRQFSNHDWRSEINDMSHGETIAHNDNNITENNQINITENNIIVVVDDETAKTAGITDSVAAYTETTVECIEVQEVSNGGNTEATVIYAEAHIEGVNTHQTSEGNTTDSAIYAEVHAESVNIHETANNETTDTTITYSEATVEESIICELPDSDASGSESITDDLNYI